MKNLNKRLKEKYVRNWLVKDLILEIECLEIELATREAQLEMIIEQMEKENGEMN